MQQFTPLPLRARSVLELIDTSLKVYKQYFLVLLGWSAGIHFLGVLPAIVPPLAALSYLAFLLTPFKISVAACCIAGAVRGQNVTFRQCWDFTKPRFGPMLGWLILAWIVGLLGCILAVLPGGILMGVLTTGALGMGGGAGAVAGVVFGFMLFFVAISLGMVFLFSWSYMVPLVVCMEEGSSRQNPMTRTWALLRGNWSRLTGLTLVLGLAVVMVMLAVGATGAWGIGLDEARRQITGGTPSPEFMRAIIGASIGISFIMTFFEPAMALAMVLFYLDVRVRQEALDLEWSAHQSQSPETPTSQFAPNTTVPNFAPTPGVFETQTTLPTDTVFSAPAPPIGTPLSDFIMAPDVAPPSVSATSSNSPAAVPDAPAVTWQSLVEEAEPPPVNAPLPGGGATLSCPKCGAISPATSTFCMTCGALLKSDA